MIFTGLKRQPASQAHNKWEIKATHYFADVMDTEEDLPREMPSILSETSEGVISTSKTPPKLPSKDFKHVLERQNLKRQASKQAPFSEGIFRSNLLKISYI